MTPWDAVGSIYIGRQGGNTERLKSEPIISAWTLYWFRIEETHWPRKAGGIRSKRAQHESTPVLPGSAQFLLHT
jgi:hypothetical protein